MELGQLHKPLHVCSLWNKGKQTNKKPNETFLPQLLNGFEMFSLRGNSGLKNHLLLVNENCYSVKIGQSIKCIVTW